MRPADAVVPLGSHELERGGDDDGSVFNVATISAMQLIPSEIACAASLTVSCFILCGSLFKKVVSKVFDLGCATLDLRLVQSRADQVT